VTPCTYYLVYHIPIHLKNFKSVTLFTGHEVGNIMPWHGKEKSNKQNVAADVLKMGL